MSEYGWSLEYCLKIPHTIIFEFHKAIVARKKADIKLYAKIMAVAVGAGFNGKIDIMDKLFKEDEVEEADPEQWKAETKAMWLKFGKDPEEFEKKWKAGEQIVI
jgi:hypothetical protein